MQYIISKDCSTTGILQQGTIDYSGMTFGRTHCNSINDLTVEPSHLKVDYRNGKWYANDISTFGSFIRIKPNQPIILKYGAYTVFGQHG